jgi:hypothetical protein
MQSEMFTYMVGYGLAYCVIQGLGTAGACAAANLRQGITTNKSYSTSTNFTITHLHPPGAAERLPEAAPDIATLFCAQAGSCG